MHYFIGILPARLQSSRFPNKVLVSIQGKTLLQRTYEAAKKSPLLKEIYIVTDSVEVAKEAFSFQAPVIITSQKPKSGTERIVEAVQSSFLLEKASHIINLQADHPFTSMQTIEKLVHLFLEDPYLSVGTCVKLIQDKKIISSPHVVKCLFDKRNYALYFSRAPIPYIQNTFSKVNYYQHVGIYGYTRKFLLNYPKLEQTPLQSVEDLEQLCFLENGYPIKVAIVDDIAQGVDVPEDIVTCEKILCQSNMFL